MFDYIYIYIYMLYVFCFDWQYAQCSNVGITSGNRNWSEVSTLGRQFAYSHFLFFRLPRWIANIHGKYHTQLAYCFL